MKPFHPLTETFTYKIYNSLVHPAHMFIIVQKKRRHNCPKMHNDTKCIFTLTSMHAVPIP